MFKIREEIFKSIDILVDEKLKRLRFNYMVNGLITEVIDNGTYKVDIFNREDIIKSMNGTQYQVGDVVYIVVWNNNYSDKTIVCKATR